MTAVGEAKGSKIYSRNRGTCPFVYRARELVLAQAPSSTSQTHAYA